MKRLIIVAIVVLSAAGCNMPSVAQAKIEANQRWQSTRAKILYGVASEHLKVGQLDQAMTKAQEALTLDPNFAKARVLLAKVYIEQGQYDNACAELEKAKKLLVNSSDVEYVFGIAYEKAGRLEDSLECYRRAYAMDNSTMAPVMAAAEVLVSLGREREAQLYIESYLSNAGNEPGMYELAGRLAMMRGEYEASAKAYEHALDLDPKNLLYRESLARADFFAGRYQEALDSIKALSESTGYTMPLWAQTMLGDCYLAQERFSEARSAYQTASEMSPSDAGVWVNLAKVAMVMRDDQRAVIAADTALRLDHDRLDATLILGYSLMRAGQVERALSTLTGAVEAHPQSVELKCLLAKAHALSGNSEMAARMLETAVTLEPKNGMAKGLLDDLNSKRLSRAD